MELTPRQLKFCDLIVQGKHQREAYREAYPRSKNWKDEAVDSQASILKSDSKVSKRIAELRSKTEASVVETIDKLVNELNETMKIAISLGQTSSAVSAVMGKAKLLGLLVDKTDNKNQVVMEMPTIKINDKELVFDIGKDPIKK